jgi:hypothetical protein|tara:strand:+ start:115 stop:351 length:237 start_codon:yes stop_codon:yes gene_type:complete
MTATEKHWLTSQLSEFLFDKSPSTGFKDCRIFVMEGDNSEGMWELKKSELLAELVDIVESADEGEQLPSPPEEIVICE